jgi:ABC-type sugar transport system substrate-binding protein
MPTILMLVPDLMFATRIEDAGKYLNYKVQSIAPNEDADAAIARTAPALVVVSLDAPNWENAVQAAKRAGARVLAFGSHKNVEAMQTAKAAGCDEVVARSRMANELPNLLKKYAE